CGVLATAARARVGFGDSGRRGCADARTGPASDIPPEKSGDNDAPYDTHPHPVGQLDRREIAVLIRIQTEVRLEPDHGVGLPKRPSSQRGCIVVVETSVGEHLPIRKTNGSFGSLSVRIRLLLGARTVGLERKAAFGCIAQDESGTNIVDI